MCQVNSDFTEAAQWHAHLLDNQPSHAVGNENDGRLVPVSGGCHIPNTRLVTYIPIPL
jgi:hypothetical protein